jgi:hypothetical protein
MLITRVHREQPGEHRWKLIDTKAPKLENYAQNAKEPRYQAGFFANL